LREFRVVIYSGAAFTYPYVKAEPRPETADKVADAYVDRELANEAFSYVLESGAEGSIHLDQVHAAIEDLKQTDQLVDRLPRVGRVQKAVELGHGGLHDCSVDLVVTERGEVA
jgi:hypothetical protein